MKIHVITEYEYSEMSQQKHFLHLEAAKQFARNLFVYDKIDADKLVKDGSARSSPYTIHYEEIEVDEGLPAEASGTK